jgi:hypothetical protein
MSLSWVIATLFNAHPSFSYIQKVNHLHFANIHGAKVLNYLTVSAQRLGFYLKKISLSYQNYNK